MPDGHHTSANPSSTSRTNVPLYVCIAHDHSVPARGAALRRAIARPQQPLVYARHGRKLMRLKSSVCEPRYYDSMVAKVLVEGKGVIVRCRLKDAGMRSYEPTCLREHAQAGGQK